ncbi:MAG: ATP-binding cassette domain-containing protein [Planctomycetota bacterium]
MSEPLLAITDLGIAYPAPGGERLVVDGVSLCCERGAVHGLVGESGSGKSTTAMAVPGLLPMQARVRSGSIRFDGAELLGMTTAGLQRLRGRRIGVVFQDPMSALNPFLRIGTQLTEHQRLHLGCGRRSAERRAVALLERVGIDRPGERLRHYPHQFSGGQRQRIMIAAALACDPDLLIADEPTTALDVTIQAEILQLIRELQRERELAMLLITHDLGVIAQTCDQVSVLAGGCLVEQAPVRRLFSAPAASATRELLAAVPVIPPPEAEA